VMTPFARPRTPSVPKYLRKSLSPLAPWLRPLWGVGLVREGDG
jgi:hypothetical protein